MFVAALQSRFFLKTGLSRKSPHDDASSLGAWVWPSPWLRPWWWWSKVQARAQTLFALSTRHLVNFNEIIFSSQIHNMTSTCHLFRLTANDYFSSFVCWSGTWLCHFFFYWFPSQARPQYLQGPSRSTMPFRKVSHVWKRSFKNANMERMHKKDDRCWVWQEGRK